MPRHKDAVPSVEWKLHISVEVASQVQLLLTDPMRNKVRYGARSDLTEQLYKRWIAERIKEREAGNSFNPQVGGSANIGGDDAA